MQFDELLTLDAGSLHHLRPIGVIFLFRYPSDQTKSDAPLDGEYDFKAIESADPGEDSVWFAAQTIQNACGTQALLAVLLNKDGSDEAGGVDIGPNLRDFKDFTSAFPAEVCSQFLARS